MTGKERSSKDIWVDPDDAPELDDEFFEEADQYNGGKLVRRGRPRAEKTKTRITMRLDPEIIDSFKSAGPGWQTRMNKALQIFLEEHNPNEL